LTSNIEEIPLKLKRSLNDDELRSFHAWLAAAPDFLSHEIIAENACAGKLEPAHERALAALAVKIRSNPDTEALYNLLHYLRFEGGPPDAFPELPDTFGGMAHADTWGFYALLALSGFSVCRAKFKAASFPDEIAEGAMFDLSLWLSHFAANKGLTGISPRIFHWASGLFNGRNYRLGRLQFGIYTSQESLYVFKRKNASETMAFPGPDIAFDAAGQYDGVDGHFASSGVWKSVYKRENGKICGTPISPRGFADNRMVSLSEDEFEEAFVPGDLAVQVHIPAGPGFSVEACAESMDKALKFFAEFFPAKKPKAFVCESWFLDIQYEKILKSDSNILKFQREFYLFPVAEGNEDAYWRIFGEDGLKNGLAGAPRDTGMRKAVAEFLELGGRLRAGGGFFLTRDCGFGKTIYRS